MIKETLQQKVLKQFGKQGYSANDLSSIIGITQEESIALLTNELPVSSEIEHRLSKAFGTTPEYWLNITNASNAYL